MNSRERFLAALACRQADRVPLFEQLNNQELFRRFLGRRPQCYDNVEAVQLAKVVGLDAAILFHGGFAGLAPEQPERGWTSEWGVTYEFEASGWPVGYPTAQAFASLEKLKEFHPPELHERERFAAVRQAAALAHREGLAAVAALRGPFALLVWHFLGMEAAMSAMLEEPRLIELALQHYLAFHLPAADAVARAGADVAFITEDLGSTTGALISPELHRRFFLEPLRAVVTRLRQAGVAVILHSDGDIRMFIPDLVSTGISALHPIERAANMSLVDLKARYAGRLALVGNVDTKRVLQHGTPASVRQDVQRCLHEAAGGGGYVLASDHSFSNSFPIENQLEMLTAGRELGGY